MSEKKLKSLLRGAVKTALDFGPVRDRVEELKPASKMQMKRTLTRTGVERTRCQWCKHWSLEGGQKALQANPAFFEATQILTPDHMESIETHKRDESGRVVVETSSVTREKLGPSKPHAWNAYGSCHHHQELRHEDDACEAWG